MKKEEKGNPFVIITVSLAGLLIGCTAILAIFAREHMEIINDVAWSLVVLGAIGLWFAYRIDKDKRVK